MRQAMHIASKDVRYLRREIALMLGLAGYFCWAGSHSNVSWWLEALLYVTAINLTARLIHAEAIPGDRQFWLTRPYRWTSLLGAKLLFMLGFICLPIGISQLAILTIRAFPLGTELPGLLWSQVLLFAGLLMVGALAAVTSGMAPFSFAALVLATIAAMAAFDPFEAPWPAGIEWLRNSTFGLALAAIAVGVVLMQYKYRATRISRVGAAAGMAVAAAICFVTPLAWAFPLQSWLSRQPSLGSTVRLSLAARQIQFSPTRGEHIPPRMILHISVAGLAEGLDIRSDAATVTFDWPGKPPFTPDFNGLSRRSKEGSIDLPILMPPALLHENLEAPLTLHGSLCLTVFGNSETRTIPLDNSATTAQDGLRCFKRLETSDPGRLFCQSFFRWPSRLVYANTGEGDINLNGLISYSPFPAALGIYSGETYFVGLPAAAVTRATIVTKEPLAHFRRNFEVRGIRFADIEEAPY